MAEDKQSAFKEFHEGRSQSCAAELFGVPHLSATISSNWPGQAIEK